MNVARTLLVAFFAQVLISMLAAQQPTVAPLADDRGLRFGRPDFQFGRTAGESNLPGYPLFGVSYLYQFEADFDSSAGDLGYHEASLWAPVLPASYGDFHLFAMVGYRFTEFDASAGNAVPTDGLHTIRVPIALLHDHSEEWLFGAMVMPTVAGDLSSGDGFQIAAAVGGGRAFGSHLRILGGVYYSHVFGEDTVIPGILFTWRPGPRWETYFFGPLAGVSYSINDDWVLSFTGRWSSPDWYVEADSRGPDRDIELRGLRLGLKLEGRLSDRIWGYVTGGATVLQEIEIEDEAGADLLDDELDSAPFVRAGLNFRF